MDLCYRPQPFPSETKRMEYLFELYDRYTAGLFVKEKKGKKVKATAIEVPEKVDDALADAEPVEVSSPVCYADSPGLREGFGEEA